MDFEPLEQTPRQKGLTFDSFVLIVAGMVFVTSVVFFFSDGFLFSESNLGKLNPVGQVSIKRNEVRRRLESGLTWTNIKPQDPVFEGDSIFTGDSSDATVNLKQGGSLIIDPKSLLVVRTRGRKLEVDLQYGSLVGKVKEDAPLVISQGKMTQELTAKNAEVRIERAANRSETQLRVVKGEITVKSVVRAETKKVSANKNLEPSFEADPVPLVPAEPQILKENEILDIRPNAAPVKRKTEVTLLSPKPNSTFWIKEDQGLRFQWKRVDASEPSTTFQTTYKLEIARDTSFNRPLVSYSTDQLTFEVARDTLPLGSFFWRILPESNDSNRLTAPTLPNRVSIYPDVAPIASAPLEEQEFLFDPLEGEQGRIVNFAWIDEANSLRFHLQVARDPEFQNKIADQKIDQRSFTSTTLPAGTYYWRVMGLHLERSQSPWSATQTFHIKEILHTLNPPVLTVLKQDFRIPESTLSRLPSSLPPSEGVKPEGLKPFVWLPVENAVGYQVEVADNSEFLNSRILETNNQTQFIPNEVKPGDLFLRVRTKGHKDRLSEPSKVGQLFVTVPAPKLDAIAEMTQKFKSPSELGKGEHTFEIKWAEQPYIQKYELEWALDQNFSQSKKFLVSKPTQEIRVQSPREYHARVRSLASDGRPLSPYSEVQKASYKKLLLPPPVLPQEPATLTQTNPAPPLDAPKVSDMNKPGSVPAPKTLEPKANTSVLSLPSSSTYINFKWSKLVGADYYTLQIATDSRFSKVLTEKKIRATNFFFESSLPNGKVYWRVRSHKGKISSDWSSANDINVINQE